MDKKTFYELVDIETPDDFKFYDNIENLIESDEEWDIDILSPLLSELPSNLIAELIDEYFNNLLDRLPDDETDLYTLIYNVSRTMKGILNSDITASDCDSEYSSDYDNENANGEKDIFNDTKRRLAYELKKFSDWFSKENLVDVKNLENGIEFKTPLRDVLGMITLEKLGMGSYSYDFAGCNADELDEYILNFSDFANSEQAENAEEYDER